LSRVNSVIATMICTRPPKSAGGLAAGVSSASAVSLRRRGSAAPRAACKPVGQVVKRCEVLIARHRLQKAAETICRLTHLPASQIIQPPGRFLERGTRTFVKRGDRSGKRVL
jgi:hypothetical protein